jgi:HEAT repeat protein
MSQSGTPLEALLGDLTSPQYRVRWKSVRDLGSSRDPRAFEPLLGALGDRLPTIRIAALLALGRLRDRRAIGPAVAMLEDPDAKVRASAAAALKRFGKPARAPMLEAYRGGGPGARSALLGALGRIASPAISELLIAALEDPREDIRLEAARVLGVRKDRQAVTRLLRAAAEGGPHRFIYIRVLGEIGDPAAFEPLAAFLAAPGFMLGHEVVMALRRIDNARAVDLFHERLGGRPGAEVDLLAHTLAGTDLLNAICSLARGARASGDLETLARAASTARDALEVYRSRLEALEAGGTPEVADESEVQGADPVRYASAVGLDILRKLESALRDLGRGR